MGGTFLRWACDAWRARRAVERIEAGGSTGDGVRCVVDMTRM